MSTYTEYGKLKEVIVGNVINFNLDKLDKTFQVGYSANFEKNKKIKEAFSLDFTSFKDYKVDNKKVIERQEDLDNLAKLLIDLGIKVRRPKKLDKIQTFKTPKFFGVLTPVTNPRDRVFIYGNNIIETPCMVRKRYFENHLLYDLLQEYYESGYNWISAPMPGLTSIKFDSEWWENERRFNDFDKLSYDIAFDAAQMLKIGKDILFNISSYNHELGANRMQRVLDSLGTGAKIHKIYGLDDNHIDGKISVLREGIFLVNNTFLNKNIKDFLPDKFKDWEVIYTSTYKDYGELKKNSDIYNYTQLCSTRGSFTNVLSIDEETVLVLDTAIDTIDILTKKGFKVIPIQLRHCELFGGGIHCATLDVSRDS